MWVHNTFLMYYMASPFPSTLPLWRGFGTRACRTMLWWRLFDSLYSIELQFLVQLIFTCALWMHLNPLTAYLWTPSCLSSPPGQKDLSRTNRRGPACWVAHIHGSDTRKRNTGGLNIAYGGINPSKANKQAINPSKANKQATFHLPLYLLF